MLFDSGFTWAVLVPVVWLLIHRTGLPLLPVYAILGAIEASKSLLGGVLVHKGIWVQNIINQ